MAATNISSCRAPGILPMPSPPFPSRSLCALRLTPSPEACRKRPHPRPARGLRTESGQPIGRNPVSAPPLEQPVTRTLPCSPFRPVGPSMIATSRGGSRPHHAKGSKRTRHGFTPVVTTNACAACGNSGGSGGEGCGHRMRPTVIAPSSGRHAGPRVGRPQPGEEQLSLEATCRSHCRSLQERPGWQRGHPAYARKTATAEPRAISWGAIPSMAGEVILVAPVFSFGGMTTIVRKQRFRSGVLPTCPRVPDR